MRSKRVQMWVDPEFKKAMKHRAADEGTSIEEATRKMAEAEDEFIRRNKRKGGFNFRM